MGFNFFVFCVGVLIFGFVIILRGGIFFSVSLVCENESFFGGFFISFFNLLSWLEVFGLLFLSFVFGK